MLNRKKDCMKKTVGIALAVLIGAHLAAGALICAQARQNRAHSIGGMVKKAKRTVVGLVREII